MALLPLKLDCIFRDEYHATEFAKQLNESPENLLEQLRLACGASQEEPWEYWSSGILSESTTRIGGYLVFESAAPGVWRTLGSGLHALGATRVKISRQDSSAGYCTGIEYVLDGKPVSADRYALAGLRSDPVVAALEQDDLRKLQALLSSAESPPANLLNQAAIAGAITCLDWLLVRFAELISKPDPDGNTPLASAVMANQVEAVHRLIAAGADVNVGAHLSGVLREFKAMQDLMEEEESFYSYRACYRFVIERSFVYDAHSITEWALLQGAEAIAHALLDAKATLCWGGTDDTQSSLIPCIQGGSMALLERVLERARQEGVNEPDGESWVYEASYLQRTAMVERLLALGLSIDKPGANGETPLHAAVVTASFKSHKMVAFLLKHGATVDVRDGEGVTPFMRALDLSNLSEARLLLAAGANTKLKDNAGRNCSHRAKEAGFSLKHFLEEAKELALADAKENAQDVP